VLLHEYAHLLEANHSKRFYAIIESYMPEYKIYRKLLG
jgi:predicted metal-dependent hydrolase